MEKVQIAHWNSASFIQSILAPFIVEHVVLKLIKWNISTR